MPLWTLFYKIVKKDKSKFKPLQETEIHLGSETKYKKKKKKLDKKAFI
jgi:hypothetical protein